MKKCQIMSDNFDNGYGENEPMGMEHGEHPPFDGHPPFEGHPPFDAPPPYDGPPQMEMGDQMSSNGFDQMEHDGGDGPPMEFMQRGGFPPRMRFPPGGPRPMFSGHGGGGQFFRGSSRPRMNGPRGPPQMRPRLPYMPRYPNGNFPPGGMRMPPYGGQPHNGPMRFMPPPQMSQLQQPQQTPENQAEKLKKVAGVPMDKELWVETKASDDKFYYYNAVSRETVWERPTGDVVIMGQEELQQLVDKSQQEEKEAASKQQQPQAYPQMFPPYGGFPNFGGFPPMAAAPPANPNDAWQEFTAPNGKKYYYNMITQENVWDKPQALKDKEAATAGNAPAISQAPPLGLASALGVLKPVESSSASINDNASKSASVSVGYAGFQSAEKSNASSNGNGTAKDSSRPVSSNAVAGTPWCVVWTGDNRVFFFNPSTRTSVWERPPELYNRPDVDLLVSKPPEKTQKQPNKAKQEDSDEEEEEEPDESALMDGQDDSEDSDEEEQEPVKKKSRKEKKAQRELEQKQQQQKEKSKPLPVHEKPIDPAIQAELEAQQERNKLPIEQRLKKFRELLEEKNVSASSTWEKELSKIVFDERYLLLSAVERKAAFEAYTREKAEHERVERKKRAKEAKDGFKMLLMDAHLHGKSTFASFSSKYGKDARFKAVEKMRDREDYFRDYVDELYKKEKEEKKKKKDKAKSEFRALLAEQKDLHRKSKWSSTKKRIDNDERYKNKNLDSELREQLFRDYVSTLAVVDEDSHESESESRKHKDKSSSNSTALASANSAPQTAEEAALEERKREVEEELGEHLKERVKEHERHKIQEHEQTFKAMLADVIKTIDISWHDAKKLLRKDSRHKSTDMLEKRTKEKLFDDHIIGLERKRRDLFYQLLNETSEITFNTKWRDARKIIDENEKFAKVRTAGEKKLERDYRDWVERRHEQILEEFEVLLTETKVITYKSQKMIQENEQHLKDILAVLEKDKRYLVLNDCPEEREKLLENYLRDLDRKGPPPPPTTNQDPERRRNK